MAHVRQRLEANPDFFDDPDADVVRVLGQQTQNAPAVGVVRARVDVTLDQCDYLVTAVGGIFVTLPIHPFPGQEIVVAADGGLDSVVRGGPDPSVKNDGQDDGPGFPLVGEPITVKDGTATRFVFTTENDWKPECCGVSGTGTGTGAGVTGPTGATGATGPAGASAARVCLFENLTNQVDIDSSAPVTIGVVSFVVPVVPGHASIDVEVHASFSARLTSLTGGEFPPPFGTLNVWLDLDADSSMPGLPAGVGGVVRTETDALNAQIIGMVDSGALNALVASTAPGTHVYRILAQAGLGSTWRINPTVPGLGGDGTHADLLACYEL